MKNIALFLLFAGCGGNSPSEPSPLIVARPYETNIPPNYDKSKPTPLVVLLHGFGPKALPAIRAALAARGKRLAR